MSRIQGWIEGFQASIDFMERNLTEELDITEIAAKAALSPFYYQRISESHWLLLSNESVLSEPAGVGRNPDVCRLFSFTAKANASMLWLICDGIFDL